MPFIFIDQGSPSIRHYSTPKSQGTSPLAQSNPARTIESHPKNGPKAYQENATPKRSIRRIHQAKEIMTQPVIALELSLLTLESAWEILKQHKIKHLPITENGTLNAIVSEGDILKALAFKQANDKWVTHTVFAATETTDIHQLAHVMFDEHIGCLPIINDQHQLEGMVTRSDILKITSQYGPMEFWA